MMQRMHLGADAWPLPARLGRAWLVAAAAVLATAFALAPAATAATTSMAGSTVTNPLAFGGDQTIYTLPTNGNLNSMVVADLNGDGKPDVVANDYDGGNVIVTPNPNGPQGFAASIPVGSGPSQLAVADVNGDGHPDLVTLTGGNTVSVLLNNGDGTFGTPATYNVGSATTVLTVADVNSDSKPDIIVGDQSNLLVVLLNNGNGAFTQEDTDYPTSVTPGELVVGDFNHDGSPDLATVNYSGGTVIVYYGDGKGGFGTAQTYPAGDHPSSLAVGDFNGDGYPDLAVVDYPSFVGSGTDATEILFNNGSASTGLSDQFASPTHVADLPNQHPGGAPIVRVGDLNSDNIADLAVSDGSQIQIYPGNGDGTFGSGVGVGIDSIEGFAIADMNGDSAPDFVLSVAGFNGSIAVNPHVVPPTNITPPTLPTKALVNQEMSGDAGTWNSVGWILFNWQVQRCDQNGQNCSDDTQSGGNSASPFYFTPTPDDAGSTLRVAVSAFNAAGYTDTVYSNVTNVVPQPPVNTSPPAIAGETTPGSASVGQTLTVGGDAWNMNVTRSVEWWVCPSGDTDPSAWQYNCYFPLARGQKIIVSTRYVGYKVEAVVTATNSKYGTTYANTGLVSLLAIAPKSLRGATFDQKYGVRLNAYGGVAPWTWSVSGSLPDGLSLSSSGLLSGTPTATGIYTFTVQASDSSSPALVATHTYSLMVGPAIAPASLSDAVVGQSYTADLTATGGTNPYTWSLAPGSSLPDGLSLDTSTGIISGNPTTAGTYTFTVRVTDSSSPAVTGTRKYTLNVVSAS